MAKPLEHKAAAAAVASTTTLVEFLRLIVREDPRRQLETTLCRHLCCVCKHFGSIIVHNRLSTIFWILLQRSMASVKILQRAVASFSSIGFAAGACVILLQAAAACVVSDDAQSTYIDVSCWSVCVSLDSDIGINNNI